MRLLKIAWFAPLLVLLFSGIERSSAQQLVEAKILSVDGSVEIRRSSAGGSTFAKVNFRVADQLKAGDRIVTGWRARLVLGLTDGSQAVVGERSIVEVKDLGSSPRELFNVLKGKTRIYIEKLGGRPNPYRINTPTAVIAVRGTLFDVIVKSSETEVFVHEGEVAVSDSKLGQAVVLSAGQMTRVKREQQPAPPVPFKPGRNDDSFRPVVDTRPVAETFDLTDRRFEDRSLVTPRASTPADRQRTASPVQPASAQRAPARRP
jgi:hypothetical protein